MGIYQDPDKSVLLHLPIPSDSLFLRLNSKGFRVSFPIGRDGYIFCSKDNVNI
jgi:hypothetical protein